MAEYRAAPAQDQLSDGLGGAKTNSASTTKTNVRIPLARTEFIPCANGGAGEYVDVRGTLHLLLSTTVDASGKVHFHETANPQGVKGIGQITGDRYRGTGVTVEQVTVGSEGLPFIGTLINVFNLIGPGPGNDFRLKTLMRLTINVNGDATVAIQEERIECR